MNSRHCLVALAVALVPVAVINGVACSSGDGPSAPPVGFGTCNHPGCEGWGDAADEQVVQWDAKPLSDVEKWDGPRATATGALWHMTTPKFMPPQVDKDGGLFTAPAKVRLVANNFEYTADYSPDGGFTLMDVPTGSYRFVAEDIDGQNDVFNTMWRVVIGETNDLQVGVTQKSALEAILASVDPPLTFDPNKAHIIATITRSSGDIAGVSGVRMGKPHAAEAVLYEAEDGTPGKWVRDQESGTGPNGIGIIVNMDASPYPGDAVTIKYNKPGNIGETPDSFFVCQGAVSRAFWWEAWTPQ
jgi:hypothetical protein